LRLNSILTIIFLLCVTPVLAQYDQLNGYYKFPIKPGEQNYLSGSMGELRRTHFHGGLDIKTNGVTGLPVYAAADGFISRIKITKGGYGNALYIKHPNGTTSVYAHLKKFNNQLQKYLIKRQYENKSWTVDLFPQKNEFEVKKGDVIAFSGNSGSSSGPHLHFEIRDVNQYVLDPLRMGFDEIRDRKAPILLKVAVVCKSIDSKVNGQFGRFEFDAISGQNGFTLKEPIFISGEVGIEIYAYDIADGTRNKYGIPDLIASLDDKVFFSQNIRNIPYAKMRNILVHTNYQNSAKGGRRFNKLYVDDGNTLGIYKEQSNKGILQFNSSEESTLKILMEDPKGNRSSFQTVINPTGYINNSYKEKLSKNAPVLEVQGNVLKVEAEGFDNSHLLEVFANNSIYQVSPDYTSKNGAVYLWDLCDGLPDSIDFCSEIKLLDYQQSFFPGQSTQFYHPTVEVKFNKSTLFDTLHLNYHHSIDTLKNSEVFHFNNYGDPLKTNATIQLKPQLEYPEKYARIYSLYGKNRTSFIGGTWKGKNIEFRTRDLVKYTIGYDSVPPYIRQNKITSNSISVTIGDKKSGIRSYKAKLNGKWLLMKYDYKRKRLVTDTLDPNIPFTGELIVEVSDNTGNKTSFNTKIE